MAKVIVKVLYEGVTHSVLTKRALHKFKTRPKATLLAFIMSIGTPNYSSCFV